MSFRIGQGYDLHRLVQDRPLILGGVEIDHDKGLLGHSDADVLLHAITDAFQAVQLVVKGGWAIVNVDATIIAQEPKLAPHMDRIRESVAQCIGIDLQRVNVKAKTKEGCDAVGERRAMEVHAIALLEAM